MKTVLYILFSFFVFLHTSFSQNLISNYSFENHSSCPNGLGIGACNPGTDPFTYATPWYSPTCGTSDYFHACSSSSLVYTPTNFMGNQIAHTGNGYAGISVYDQADSQEYIQSPLSSPLVVGNMYSIEFFVSLADKSGYSIAQLGMHFSTQPLIKKNFGGHLNVIPHIVSDTILDNSSSWMKIHGCFIADSAYNYITIGNFEPSTTTSTVDPTLYAVSYYYVDDITVISIAPDISNDQLLSEGKTLQLDPKTTGDLYNWSTGETSSTITISSPGTYWVTVSHDGCSQSDTFVIYSDEVYMYTPSSFTPNNDGLNDLFFVQNDGLTELSCTIYNRWGEHLYEWNEPSGKWDGLTKYGTQVPEGIYCYLLRVKTINGENKNKIGFIEVLR